MPMFYVTLFYAATSENSEDGRPYRPEFHIEGESFGQAAAAARDLMSRDFASEVDDSLFMGPMGWEVPGVRAAKRIS